jgi:hypothetical protein
MMSFQLIRQFPSSVVNLASNQKAGSSSLSGRATSAALGTIASLALTKWIESLLFGTTPTDPAVFSLESSSCGRFQSNCVFDSRSTPSNDGLFRRKLEAQTLSFTVKKERA